MSVIPYLCFLRLYHLLSPGKSSEGMAAPTNRVYLSDVVPVLERTAVEPLKNHARVLEDKFLIAQ